jgi:hypothetical protein
MKINYVVIYMVVVGWFGFVLALGMPMLLEMQPDLQRQSDFYFHAWLAGAIACLIAGAYIIYDNRNDFGKIAALFLVSAGGSLLLALFRTMA